MLKLLALTWIIMCFSNTGWSQTVISVTEGTPVPYDTALYEVNNTTGQNYTLSGTLPPGTSVGEIGLGSLGYTATLTGTPTMPGRFQVVATPTTPFTNATPITITITVDRLAPVSGTYYDSTQGGEGYSIQYNAQTGRLFLVAYTGDDSGDGKPMWVYSTLTSPSPDSYPMVWTGTIYVCKNSLPFATNTEQTTNPVPQCTTPYNYPLMLSFTSGTTMSLSAGPRQGNLVQYTTF